LVVATTAAGAACDDPRVTIEVLDILYLPTRDAAADLAFYRDVLGGRVVFAIDAMGTRVAEVAVSAAGPRLVLAEHLDGEAPVLLHRVADLDAELAELESRGLEVESRVELPLGPCATFRSPGGQRLGIYEHTRPQVDEHFAGREDFG
jgi:predicted enzyme related to lactoylglutathione lyase